MLSLTIDRDEAARFGIQRPSSIIRCTIRSDSGRRLSSSLSSLVSRDPGVSPSLQTDPSTLNKIYVKSAHHQSAGAAVNVRRFDTHHAATFINHRDSSRR